MSASCKDAHPAVLVVRPQGAGLLDSTPRGRRGYRTTSGLWRSTNGADSEVVHAGHERIVFAALSETAYEVGGLGMGDVVLRGKEVDVGLSLL